MNDIINGLFESFAGILLLFNVIQLHKDKEVKGVNIAPTAFFCLWDIGIYISIPQLIVGGV